ncbi:hypothetical protein MRX96_007403 [Rhipicephalus microplus]
MADDPVPFERGFSEARACTSRSTTLRRRRRNTADVKTARAFRLPLATRDLKKETRRGDMWTDARASTRALFCAACRRDRMGGDHEKTCIVVASLSPLRMGVDDVRTRTAAGRALSHFALSPAVVSERRRFSCCFRVWSSRLLGHSVDEPVSSVVASRLAQLDHHSPLVEGCCDLCHSHGSQLRREALDMVQSLEHWCPCHGNTAEAHVAAPADASPRLVAAIPAGGRDQFATRTQGTDAVRLLLIYRVGHSRQRSTVVVCFENVADDESGVGTFCGVRGISFNIPGQHRDFIPTKPHCSPGARHRPLRGALVATGPQGCERAVVFAAARLRGIVLGRLYPSLCRHASGETECPVASVAQAVDENCGVSDS